MIIIYMYININDAKICFQTFVFDVRRPDLSYLTFHVYDKDVISEEFIAFSSIPVLCMRTGK